MAATGTCRAVLRSKPGRLEQTREILISIERRAAFRRTRKSRIEMQLREADALLSLVEECRLQDFELAPVSIWSAVVRLVGEVSPELRDEIGIDRHPDALGEAIFGIQESLQVRMVQSRQPQLAEIIPLFGHVESENDSDALTSD